MINGTWDGSNYFGGMSDGLVNIAPLADFAADGTQEAIDEATAKIESGDWEDVYKRQGLEIAASLSDSGYDTYSGQIGAKILCGILLLTFFLLYLLLLAYTGSLVRRIKAGTFWKNSICYKILHIMKVVCKRCIHVICRGIRSCLLYTSEKRS